MSIVNSAGETPKDVARRFGRLACVNLLGGDTGTFVLFLADQIQKFRLYTHIMTTISIISLLIISFRFAYYVNELGHTRFVSLQQLLLGTSYYRVNTACHSLSILLLV